MKKIAISLTFLLFSLIGYSQVGINTENPQGIFHIDGKGDTSDSLNLIDDVIISSDGNIGIGILPINTSKITLSDGGTLNNVRPVFQLQDGNEGINKILISDAQGNATWQEYTSFELTLGQFGSGINISVDPSFSSSSPLVAARANNTFTNTTGQIQLSPGTWLVRCSMVLTANVNPVIGAQVWIRTLLADDSTLNIRTSSMSQKSPDVKAKNSLASSFIWCNGYGGVINGTFTLTNSTASIKTYYLMVGWIDRYESDVSTAANIKTIFKCGSSENGENSLFAYRIL